MKYILAFFTVFYSIINMSGCTEEKPPHGRWEATKNISVYAEKYNPMNLAFEVQKGDICALGDKWHVDKDLSYKEVSCEKGKGWIISAQGFKKISD